MINKPINIKQIIDIIYKSDLSTDQSINNPIKAIEIISLFKQLETPNISKNIINNNFKLSNQMALDIIDLSEKYNWNNIFGYYVANHSGSTLNSATDKIMTYLACKEETDFIKEFDSTLDAFITEINIKNDPTVYEKIKEKILTKFNVYTNNLFYLFSIGLYKPDVEQDKAEIFNSYQKWITETAMGVK